MAVRVSVCLAAYNGMPFIACQVDSILQQLSEADELIISDNGSDDGTMEYLQSLDDPRLQVYVCDKRGVSVNFESALSRANGEFIFLSDQDDVWLPGRLDYGVRALSCVDLAAVSMRSFGDTADGSVIVPYKGFLRNLIKNSFPGCVLCFRRRVLGWILPFPRRLPMHDWWIALICSVFGSVSVTNIVLVRYRRHGGNFSGTGEASSVPLWTRLRQRMELVCMIALRIPKLVRVKGWVRL